MWIHTSDVWDIIYMSKYEYMPSPSNNSESEHLEGEVEKEGRLSETSFYPVFNTQLQQRYDRLATQWNTEAYDKFRRDDLIPKLLDIAQIQDGHNVLEAMCGMGIVANAVKKRFPICNVYGVDFSRGMLNAIPEGIFKVQSSVIAMPFQDACFDRILLRTAIYDLPRRMQLNALKEFQRVLAGDGIFAFQTYHTTLETRDALNEIVNLKDKLAGQYQDMGREMPRYLATIEELEEWFDKAGFAFEQAYTFEGETRFQKNKEMSDEGKQMWGDHVLELSEHVKELIKLRTESDGSLTYNFPGVMYKLKYK